MMGVGHPITTGIFAPPSASCRRPTPARRRSRSFRARRRATRLDAAVHPVLPHDGDCGRSGRWRPGTAAGSHRACDPLPALRAHQVGWVPRPRACHAAPVRGTVQAALLGHLYDFPPPDMLAWVDSLAEIILPCLLIIGLATRISAPRHPGHDGRHPAHRPRGMGQLSSPVGSARSSHHGARSG